MAGIAPGHFLLREHFASPRRRGTGGRRWQRCRSAVEQRRDAADGGAAVDAAWPVGLFFQVLGGLALRGEVFRRHLELLGQQLGRGFGAPIRQRQIVDIVAYRIGVALDQEHLARIARDRPVESVRDRLQLGRLIGWNLPRAGFEVDSVEIDARHQLTHRGAVADFVERITPRDPVHRRSQHGVVDQFRRRVLGFDNVAIVRNADYRRRQVDVETADRARIAIAIVDDDDLAASLVAANPAQQLAVAANDGDDLRAVGANHDGAGLAADLLGPNVARAVTKAFHFVVTNERLAAGIAHDDPPGLGDDCASAFLRLPPRAALLPRAASPPQVACSLQAASYPQAATGSAEMLDQARASAATVRGHPAQSRARPFQAVQAFQDAAQAHLVLPAASAQQEPALPLEESAARGAAVVLQQVVAAWGAAAAPQQVAVARGAVGVPRPEEVAR